MASSTDNISPAILAASADGVVAIDGSGTIRFGNRAAADLLAVSVCELVGSNLGHELVAGQPAEIELTLPEGRQRVLDVRTSATKLDGELVIAVLRDVTECKRSERKLQAAMQDQNAALAITAHELHSRLAAIGVLAYVLADEQVTMGLAERAKIAARIRELAECMQTLVRRVLTSAQIESGSPRPQPEHVSVLEVIVDQLAIAGAGSGRVSVRCSPALTAAVDRTELTMMLTNYVENALTYAVPPIEIVAARQDDWAVIEVTDRGPGVPRSFQPRLFERFARAHEGGREAAGIGLGLWIVRTLARANGGDAWYEPADGGGSRFLLRIPAAPGVATGHGSGGSDDQRSGRGGSAGACLSAGDRDRDPA
jgi:signal transduction histidine kinase